MAKDKYIGISNKENLAGWADYAKGNSYMPDKAKLRDNLSGEGAAADYNNHDDKDNWRQPQRKEEGRGWAKANATTADNTYTGKDGSKRD
jgi:hypothetical protein